MQLKRKMFQCCAIREKIIKKHQSFGSETQFPFKHVTDASFLAFGKKKKKKDNKEKNVSNAYFL